MSDTVLCLLVQMPQGMPPPPPWAMQMPGALMQLRLLLLNVPCCVCGRQMMPMCHMTTDSSQHKHASMAGSEHGLARAFRCLRLLSPS